MMQRAAQLQKMLDRKASEKESIARFVRMSGAAKSNFAAPFLLNLGLEGSEWVESQKNISLVFHFVSNGIVCDTVYSSKLYGAVSFFYRLECGK